jgi:hypothetical protein
MMSTKQSAREDSGLRMNEGIEQLERGEVDDAVRTLGAASQIDPSYFAPWFNLGLAYKKRREWTSALDALLRAWSKLPLDVSIELYASVLWNVGIAASIVGTWWYARRVWYLLGHNAEGPETKPPSIPMGAAWVAREGSPPVLARRLDPVRASVLIGDPGEEVLQPGTVVVHDGERIGSKPFSGRELPIFPVLDILPSPEGRNATFEQFVKRDE